MKESIKLCFSGVGETLQSKLYLVFGLSLSASCGIIFALSIHYFGMGLHSILISDSKNFRRYTIALVALMIFIWVLEFLNSLTWRILTIYLNNRAKQYYVNQMLSSNDFHIERQKYDFDLFNKQHILILSYCGKCVYEITVILASILSAMVRGWKLPFYIGILLINLIIFNYIYHQSASTLNVHYQNSHTIACKAIPHIKFIRSMNLQDTVISKYAASLPQALQFWHSQSLVTGLEMLTIDLILVSSFYLSIWNIQTGNENIRYIDNGPITLFLLSLTSLWCFELLKKHYHLTIATYNQMPKYYTNNPLPLNPPQIPHRNNQNRIDDKNQEEKKSIIEESKTDRSNDTDIKDIQLQIPAKCLYVDGISFAYKSNPTKPILMNINLKIEQSKLTLITGSKLSGKSTLLSLISGYESPTKGIISIGNKKIGIDFCSEISFIEEGSLFFHYFTYYENFMIGAEGALLNESDCIDALKKVNILNIKVADLHSKPPYMIGSEARKYAIARALLQKRSLLIIDNLYDDDNFDFTQLFDVNKKAIVITTNHEIPNTWAEKDFRIAVLNNGKIVEEGTYQMLMANKKSFYNYLIESHSKEQKPEPINGAPKQSSVYFKQLLLFLKQNKMPKYYIILVLVLSLFLGFHPFVIGLYISKSFRSLCISKTNCTLSPKTQFYNLLAFSIAFALAHTVRSNVLIKIQSNLKSSSLQKVFSYIINVNSCNIDKDAERVKEKINSEYNNVEAMVHSSCNLLSIGVELGICIIVFIVGCFCLRQWRSALAVEGFLIFGIAVIVVYEWLSFKFYNNTIRMQSNGNDMVYQCLTNKYSVKTLNIAYILELYKKLLSNNKYKSWLSFIIDAFYSLFRIALLLILLSIYDIIMKKTNNFSMYDCLFIALYTMFFIHKIIPNLLEGYINSNSQLFQILQHHSQRNEGDLINSITVGKIEMKNVSFSYPGSNQKILNQMSMSIPSDYVSKVIALVGLNGCGKSTVLQLLNKQHQIGNGGSILIDDIDIKNYTSSAICGSIFLIPHCNSTIEEYIGEIVQLDVSKISEELKNEIETINCLIDNPLLKTALAHALIKKPKIVLIDEATNDLTSEQEEVVLNFITSFRPTCIIATHKPSTIRRADYILVMSDGKIKEQGKHEELMALKGLYYAIVTH